jgi:hypothetical protein
MKYLTVILLFISLSVQSQIPVFRLPFNGSGRDSSGNAFAGHMTGGADSTFNSSIKVEGAYSWQGTGNRNWESKASYNTGLTWSISMNFRYVSTTGYYYLFTNRYDITSPGFSVAIDGTNNRIYGKSVDESLNEDNFYCENASVSSGTWYHAVVIFNTFYVRVYVNDIKLVLTDSTIQNDYRVNDTLAIGSTTNGSSYALTGYVDNVHFYKYVLSSAQVDSLYQNRASSSFSLGKAGSGGGEGGGGTTYNPQPGYHARVYYNGVEKKPSYNGVTKYFVLRRLPYEDTQILFKEDFEDWSVGVFGENDIITKWQAMNWGWLDPYGNSIENYGSTYGKVWRMDYPSGSVGGDGGFSFGIPLGRECSEAWLSCDYYIPSTFDAWNNTSSKGGGKILPGFYGGPHVSIPYSTLPAIADSNTNGWMAHVTFNSSSSSNTYINSYMYWVSMYSEWDIDWGVGVYGTGDVISNPMATGWHNYKMRIKLNSSIISADGFVEIYIDNVLKCRHTGMRFRTNTESAGITKWIDRMFFGFWFGGDGTTWRSDAANYVRYDNIIAYIPGVNSLDYYSGYNTSGVSHNISFTGYQYADDFFTDETFSTSTGTVYGFRNIWMAPSMISTDYCTKTITVAGATAYHITFPYWKITIDYGAGSYHNGYVKVYNAANTLLYTFDAAHLPSGTYDITSSSIHLKYYSGLNGIDGGWTCTYTTNGS